MARLEKDFKDRLRRTAWRGKPGKSTTTTTTDGTITTDEGGGGDGDGEMEEKEEKEGGGGGGKSSIEIYDPELVERKIKEIEDKWKIRVEQLENEKVKINFNLFFKLIFRMNWREEYAIWRINWPK